MRGHAACGCCLLLLLPDFWPSAQALAKSARITVEQAAQLAALQRFGHAQLILMAATAYGLYYVPSHPSTHNPAGYAAAACHCCWRKSECSFRHRKLCSRPKALAAQHIFLFSFLVASSRSHHPPTHQCIINGKAFARTGPTRWWSRPLKANTWCFVYGPQRWGVCMCASVCLRKKLAPFSPCTKIYSLDGTLNSMPVH